MRVRKLPVEVEAEPWDGGEVTHELAELIRGHFVQLTGPPGHKRIDIPTLEGTMTARPGDWLIRGVNGEVYPCHADVFTKTYEVLAPDREGP